MESFSETLKRIRRVAPYLGRRNLRHHKDLVLYHYCSSESLVQILTHRTLRFSDITALNDEEERIWGRGVFHECLRRLEVDRGVPLDFPQVDQSFIDAIEFHWDAADAAAQIYAACFSLDGDSLSQWRSYADDGTGFALGIQLVPGIQWCFQALQVEYDEDAQIEEMFGSLAALTTNFGNLEDFSNPELPEAIVAMVGNSIAFKYNAFRDEQELRIAHPVIIDRQETAHFLKSSGYPERPDGMTLDPPQVQFEARGKRIVPFVDLSFADPEPWAAIKRLHLGPKCALTEDAAQAMLGTLGYEGVQISRAGARYR